MIARLTKFQPRARIALPVRTGPKPRGQTVRDKSATALAILNAAIPPLVLLAVLLVAEPVLRGLIQTGVL